MMVLSMQGPHNYLVEDKQHCNLVSAVQLVNVVVSVLVMLSKNCVMLCLREER